MRPGGILTQPGRTSDRHDALAGHARAGFARFWTKERGYCYDVIDGPDGDDPALRPNQLLAVALPHSPLDAHQQRTVVDVCARHLLTSHGLHSLAPDDPTCAGHYGGDQHERDAACHQGTMNTQKRGLPEKLHRGSRPRRAKFRDRQYSPTSVLTHSSTIVKEGPTPNGRGIGER